MSGCFRVSEIIIITLYSTNIKILWSKINCNPYALCNKDKLRHSGNHGAPLYSCYYRFKINKYRKFHFKNIFLKSRYICNFLKIITVIKLFGTFFKKNIWVKSPSRTVSASFKNVSFCTLTFRYIINKIWVIWNNLVFT